MEYIINQETADRIADGDEKRRSLRPKTRFEVFKRDSFRCQYCGRSAPDVVLEVDHIHPVAEGGDDDLANLLTACRDCNQGKGKRLLSDHAVVEKQHQQLEELQERREQLEMMLKWRDELAAFDTEALDLIAAHFERLADCTVNERGRTTLRRLMAKYSFDEILHAMNVSASQYLESDDGGYTAASVEKAFKFVARICSVVRAEKEKPYIKELFYIRGILRKRVSYCQDAQALAWLEEAYLLGVPAETLRALVLKVRTWSEFRTEIGALMRYAQEVGSDGKGA